MTPNDYKAFNWVRRHFYGKGGLASDQIPNDGNVECTLMSEEIRLVKKAERSHSLLNIIWNERVSSWTKLKRTHQWSPRTFVNLCHRSPGLLSCSSIDALWPVTPMGQPKKLLNTLKSPWSGHKTGPTTSSQLLTGSTGKRTEPGEQIPELLTIVVTRIGLEGAQGLNFRVAAFMTACKAGHFSRVINPFVFTDSKKRAEMTPVTLCIISARATPEFTSWAFSFA